MEFTGKVIAALPPRGGVSQKGNSWKSQQFVLREEKDKYPQTTVVEVFGEDKLNEFNLQVGEFVKVAFDINADEYNGRWYNRLRVFAVERVGDAPAQQNLGAAIYQKPKKQEETPEPQGNDQLPF